MSLIQRLDNKTAKLEKKIDIKMKKIEDINLKFHNGEISKKEYNSKKKHNEEIIKKMNINLRMLRGEVARKKRLNDINKIKKTSQKSGKKSLLIGMKELNKNIKIRR